MDADYLRRETEKLGIGPMRERVEQLAAYWFANKPGAADKELRELEAFCFLSGSYGGYLSQRICLMRKKQKNESGVGWKLQYFWHRLFPPFAILCMRYPKLKTAPWLLPYFWLCRLFDFSYWKTTSTARWRPCSRWNRRKHDGPSGYSMRWCIALKSPNGTSTASSIPRC